MGARNAEKFNLAARWAALALAGLLLAAPLAAVTMRALSLDELVQTSDRVVVATIVSNEGRWDDAGAKIFTYTTIRVDEYIKGDGASGDTLVIVTLGGAVGDKGMHIEGAPIFRPGDKEVLFLYSDAGSSDFGVRGWNQGRFKVLTHPDTGQEMVVRSLTGTRIVGTAGGKTKSEFSSIRTLDDLRTAVRSRSGKGE